MSKQISRLETRLGARLLNRSTRRISLTDVGREFYERSRSILSDIDDAERAVGHASDEPRGRLRVTASISFGQRQIVPLVPEFIDRFADVRVDVLYTHFPSRVQAAIDCIIYLFFLLPVSAWITWRLGEVALEAFRVGEVSGESAWNPVIWPIRSIAAFGFLLFTLQILAEGMRTFRQTANRSEEQS